MGGTSAGVSGEKLVIAFVEAGGVAGVESKIRDGDVPGLEVAGDEVFGGEIEELMAHAGEADAVAVVGLHQQPQ